MFNLTNRTGALKSALSCRWFSSIALYSFDFDNWFNYTITPRLLLKKLEIAFMDVSKYFLTISCGFWFIIFNVCHYCFLGELSGLGGGLQPVHWGRVMEARKQLTTLFAARSFVIRERKRQTNSSSRVPDARIQVYMAQDRSHMLQWGLTQLLSIPHNIMFIN